MASFQPVVPPVTLTRLFRGVAMTRYKTLSADCSSGKWPGAPGFAGYAQAGRLLGRARGEFFRLWHEGEAPSNHWGCDRRAYRREISDPAELARRARDAAKARERRKARAAA